MENRVSHGKRFLALVCVMLLVSICALIVTTGVDETYASGNVWTGDTALTFAGGDGSQSSPYLIANGEQLSLLAGIVNGDITNVNGETINPNDYNSVGVYFALSADIVLNDTTHVGAWSEQYAPRNSYTSIGTVNKPFSAQFDGNNHTITGAYVVSSSRAGIFGYVMPQGDGESVTIQNLRVEDSFFKSSEDVGSIAGRIYGKVTIQNCYSNATIRCSSLDTNMGAGGIVGYMRSKFKEGDPNVQDGCTISDCIFEGGVFGTRKLGGIVGKSDTNNSTSSLDTIYQSTVKNCINRGLIECDTSSTLLIAGGIIGDVAYECNIIDSGNEGVVKGADRAGGIFGSGYKFHGDFLRLWNTGTISSNATEHQGSAAGGLFGYVETSSGPEEGRRLSMEDLYNSGEVSGLTVGGIIGEYISETTYVDSIYNAVNEGYLYNVGAGTTLGAFAGSNSKAQLGVYNFVNYNRDIFSSVEDIKFIGTYVDAVEMTTISDSLFFRTSFDADKSAITENGNKLHIYLADGKSNVSMPSILNPMAHAVLHSVLNILNDRSETYEKTPWVNAGDKYGKGGETFKYVLPETFVTRFGVNTSLNAWDDTQTNVYDTILGTGTKADPYTINSAQGLFTLRVLINNHRWLGSNVDDEGMKKYNSSNVYYRLDADIYLNEIGDFETWMPDNLAKNKWTPIGKDQDGYRFAANFDGGNHTIYGMQVALTESDMLSGLFGYLQSGGSVSNLKIKKSMIVAKTAFSGGIAAISNGRIENCSFSGKIIEVNQTYDLGMYIGGICGFANGSTIVNCESDAYMEGKSHGTVYGVSRLGGIAGIATGLPALGESEILNSKFYGEINSKYSAAGGIVGALSSSSKVVNCVNYGTLSGGFHFGGIAGIAEQSSTISSCQSAATSSLTIIDLNRSATSVVSVGGLVGGLDGGKIIGSQSSATILLNDGFRLAYNDNPRIRIGGLVGTVTETNYPITIINSRTTKDAKALCGQPYAEFTGAVSTLGGLVGYASTNQYFDLLNCINEMTLEYTGSGSLREVFYSAGLIGRVTDSAKIRNCVNFKSEYIVGLASSDAGLDAQFNYSASAVEFLTNAAVKDKIRNNKYFDPSTGKLTASFRFEVSGILVASVDEALNAYATENNFDETGALKSLEDRLAYFKMGGGASLTMSETPYFFTRFIANQPYDKQLNGGFFVPEGGKANKPNSLNGENINVEGFTLQGWFEGEDKFDFSTPVTRNYTLNTIYTIDQIAIKPTEDISVDYDGNTRDISLNPQISFNSSWWKWYITYTGNWNDQQPWDGDSASFNLACESQRIGLKGVLTVDDGRGTVYTTTIEHIFTVEIRRARLTVSGLYAVDRVYNTELGVELKGGELSGIKSKDGVSDDVTITYMPTTGTLLDKNVGANKPVQFEDITVGGNDIANYYFVQPIVTVNITPAQLALNGVTASDKVYDGNTSVKISAINFNGLLGSDDVVFDAKATSASVKDKKVGQEKPVTVHSVVLSGLDKDNYTCTIPTGLTVDITPKMLDIIDLHPSYASRAYDQTTKVDLTGGTLVGLVDGDSVSCVMPTTGNVNNKNVAQNKEVSVVPPTLTGADASNYNVRIASSIYVDIVQKDVSILNLQAKDRFYNRTTVVELTNSGLSGFYNGDDVNFDIPTMGTIGEVYVGNNKGVNVAWGAMSGIDANNYKIILPTLVTVNITPKTLSIEGIQAVAREYDGTNKVLLSAQYAQLSGVESGDQVTFSLPQFGILDSAAAGIRNVEISGIVLKTTTEGSEDILKNYTIGTHSTTVNISLRQINTLWDSNVSFTYNGRDQMPSATASTGVNGEYAVLTIDGAQANAGTGYTATATIASVTGGDVSNYELAGNTTEFSIAQREVTVSVNQAIDYTGASWSNSEWNGMVSGLVTNHTFSGTITTKGFAVQTYKSDEDGFIYEEIKISNGTGEVVTSNYSISYNLTVTISHGQIVYTVNNYEGSFDNAPHTISLNVTTGSVTIEYSTDGNEFTNEAPVFTNAGKHTVYFRLSSISHNTVSGSATVNILPAEITVTIIAQDAEYTGSGNAAEFSITNNITNVDVTLTYIGRSNGGIDYNSTTAPTEAGRYTVTATIVDTNHTLKPTSKTFNIERATAAIDVSGVEKEYKYNGSQQIVDSGAVLSHNETELVYKNNTFTKVGNGRYTVIISAEQTNNYSAVEETVEITVKKAVLNNQTKASYTTVYNGASHGITFDVEGFLGADDISSASIEYSENDSDWQADPILVKYVKDSKLVYYRMTFEDYESLSGSVDIDISARDLTINGVTGGEQVYSSGTKVLVISGGRLEGAIMGDIVSPEVPTSGTMADKHVGKDKLVTIGEITLTGADAGNYTLTQPKVYVTVTPYTLSVQGLNVQNKVYDGSTAIIVGTTGSILITPFTGDDVNVWGVTASAGDANVGVKNITIESITLIGKDKDNYTVTLPTGWQVNITPKELNFTLTASGGVYSGSAIGASVNVSGYLPDESGTVSLRYTGTTNGGSAYDDSIAPILAGSYTVTASIDNSNYSLGESVSKQFVIARANSVIDVNNVKTKYAYTGYPQIVNSGATLNHNEASIVYSDNVFTNVGTGSYTVGISVAQTDNYHSASVTVSIEVAKSSYDISNLVFADGVFIANGSVYSLSVTGLPSGVTVEYIGNGQSEAGIYTVTAVFRGDYDNYERIEDKFATLNIRKTSLVQNDVEISSEYGFDADIELNSQSVNSSEYPSLNLDDMPLDVFAAKDISFIKNGQQVGPNGTITIKLLIDESLRNRNDLMVIFIADNGEITNMNATRQGDYMVFDTDHNSIYAIVAYRLAPQGLPTGAIVGIVIGIIVVLAVLIILILLLRRRKNNPKGGNDKGGNDNNTPNSQTFVFINTNDNSADEGMESEKQPDALSDDTQSEEKDDVYIDDDVNIVDNHTEDDHLEDELSADTCESVETESADNQDTDADGNGDEAKEEESLEITADETAICSDNQADNDESRILEEESEANASESPVEEESQNTESSIADAEGIDPSQENAVVFVSQGQSLEDAFQSLSREQKDFYERLRSYALEKTGATSNKTQNYETVRVGRKNIVKFFIKRNTTVAAFSLEHPLLKLYKKQSVEDEGDAIKIKPTEVFVSNVAAFKAAKDMIDIVVRQIDLEKEEARKLRNSKKKAKSAEASKG